MKFTPKSEEDFKKWELLKPGVYPFTVMESEEVLSKSEKNRGRAMVKVKLNVHGPGFDAHVYDYFADWFSEWKLKHFCESVDIEADYENGEVDPSRNAWEGKEGFVEIEVEAASGNYAEKNSVIDYRESLENPDEKPQPENKPEAPAPTPTEPVNAEDDVPFN